MNEIDEVSEEYEKRISHLEDRLKKFKDLNTMADSCEVTGEQMLAKLTKHVLAEGMNEKVRELRQEFLSRSEWKNQSTNMIKHKDLDELDKRLGRSIVD